MILQSNYLQYRWMAALLNSLENEWPEPYQELLEEYPFLHDVHKELRAAGWERDRNGTWMYTCGLTEKDQADVSRDCVGTQHAEL